MAEHDWLPSENYMHPPPDSVVAGHDSDGVVIYVARAYHRGELLPAKFMPDKSYCAVPYGGEEVSKKELEVLRGHGYIWEPASHGHVPEHAVIGGRTAEGEPLFIGRGHWHGSLTPGKVHPSHGCLYIPYGHGEHRIDNYEVLVRPHIESWVRAYGSEIVPGTIHAGHDADGDPIYVGRAYHAGDLLPAKVIPNKQCAYVCHGGREIHKTEYELLVGHNYGWSPSSHGSVPPKAVVCGKTSDGEPLYIGRGHYQGSLTPGKVHCSHGCLYIPFGGDEVRLDHYEVLVRT